MSAPSTLGKFIIVFLLVFTLILLYGKVMKGSTKIMECTTNGGECVDGTCKWGKQVPALSDKAAGCNKGQICCINITQSEKQADPLCLNGSSNRTVTIGTSCKSGYYCDAAHQCVTRCEFCSTNYAEFSTSPICRSAVTNFTQIGKRMTCACNVTECRTLSSSGCVWGYCQGDAVSNYCCVK